MLPLGWILASLCLGAACFSILRYPSFRACVFPTVTTAGPFCCTGSYAIISRLLIDLVYSCPVATNREHRDMISFGMFGPQEEKYGQYRSHPLPIRKGTSTLCPYINPVLLASAMIPTLHAKDISKPYPYRSHM